MEVNILKDLPKTWTQTLRYQDYSDWPSEYVTRLSQEINQSSWRFHYHIQTPTGLLNDPNGFSYFNGEWHLFYQFYPMGPVHGKKSWYHLTSKNLIDWESHGIAIFPDSPYDSHGAYSGSALPLEDKLFIMYTGNVRNKNWERHPYQIGMTMDKDGIFSNKVPLIDKQPTNITEHFRDPQIFRYHHHYLMLIGAQKEDETGTMLLYRSDDLQHFENLGELNIQHHDLGYMVECPNLVFIDDRPVLLFCPQGMSKKTSFYENIYPNSYVIGEHLDETTVSLGQTSSIENLDEGFDVYATQAFNAPDGRALAISWIGLPDISYPSDKEGWAHCLSLVKTLQLKENHLYQYPVEETKQLRQTKQSLSASIHADTFTTIATDQTCYELHTCVANNDILDLALFADSQTQHALHLVIDAKQHQVTLDRGTVGEAFATEFGTTRTCSVEEGDIEVTIFADTSVVEIYINHGYRTMTARFFPEANQTIISAKGSAKTFTGTLYTLRNAKLNQD